jgi:hypothetical protein
MLSRDEAGAILAANVEALGDIADSNVSPDVRVRALAAQQRGLALAAAWADGSEVEPDEETDVILDELASRRVAR